MRSRIPSQIRWTGHKKMEELLDDPLAESLYGLFLKVKDSPRHIAFKPERLINEVYYMCNRFYQENDPYEMLEEFSHEIESDMGWRYASELVMPMACVVLKSQKSIPARIERLVLAIEDVYGKSCYWNVCQQLLAQETTIMPGRFNLGNEISSLIKSKRDISKLLGKNPVFIINNVEQLNAILGKNAKILK